MTLRVILDRGIASALDGRDGELVALCVSAGLPEEAAAHVRQTLEALPGLLESMHEVLAAPAVAATARRLFLGVLRYLFLDEDLVPSRGGQVLLGLFDDVYLVHRAAQELRDHLHPIDMRSIDGGAHLLGQVLPADVIGELDALVVRAAAEAGEG